MKREVQLFHEVNGAREYPVSDENATVKDFVFSVVEELQSQDKEFFDVYASDGSRIGERTVADANGPYIVVCDIISARAECVDCDRLQVGIPGGFHQKLRTYLESFDEVETCGFLIGTWHGEVPRYLVGVFPELELQTRNDSVVGSQDVALILLGARSAQPSRRLALAWIHTHLDTPPRLSAKDRRTLGRLRMLAPDTCAMVFNRHFPDLDMVSYLSDETRVPLLKVADAIDDAGFVTSVRAAIERIYASSGRRPPRFIT